MPSHGSSVITQPVGSQTAPSVLSRAANTLHEMFHDGASLTDPAELSRVLRLLSSNVAAALRVLGANPILFGNHCRGIQMTNGTISLIAHGLNRPWQGYICTRMVSASAIFAEGAMPTGTTTSQFLALSSLATGTFDFYVF